ncbi:MAG: FtsH protease activity modulator HflK, partial [Gammaproteobacteria bacterium]|nr:FtsH protease activity modulator HflK [Gammaproteobacteria bacterium]
MPWNEPGGQKKDPWGNKGNQGPPDLDELFGQLKNKLSGLFGGGSGGNSGQQSTGKGVSLIAVILLAAWGLSGLYIINDGERGVELRFGAFTQITLPGPHWHLPYPIESVETVNVSINRSVQSRAEMLTSDENIVQIELAVQYNIKDAAEYLFNVRAPDFTMQQAMESAVREVVGKNDMDFIITQGRGEIAINTKTLLQDILDRYKTGLFVTKVNLGDAQPPEQVQGAFADAIKAREDEQRYINEAEAYRNDVVPKARGDAQRLLEEAA